jgi:hypothetical protein
MKNNIFIKYFCIATYIVILCIIIVFYAIMPILTTSGNSGLDTRLNTTYYINSMETKITNIANPTKTNKITTEYDDKSLKTYFNALLALCILTTISLAIGLVLMLLNVKSKFYMVSMLIANFLLAGIILFIILGVKQQVKEYNERMQLTNVDYSYGSAFIIFLIYVGLLSCANGLMIYFHT